MSTRDYGFLGEDLAVKFLKKLKYKIVERNFACKDGEIDIIAKDGDAYVFVEVKRRKDDSFARPIVNVNHTKQTKLSKTARYYIMTNRIDAFCRFDVIEIVGSDITHIKNAFYFI